MKDRQVEQYGLFAIGRPEPVLLATKTRKDILERVVEREGSGFFVARMLRPIPPIRGIKKNDHAY